MAQITRVWREITPEPLALHDVEMKRAVEPGEFETAVGTWSRDEQPQTVVLHTA